MALLRHSTRRFVLSSAWLVVVVVSPLSLSSSYRVALLLVVLGRLFLLLVLGSSSILSLRRSSLSSLSSLLFACRGWFRFTVVGFDLPSLVSICCRCPARLTPPPPPPRLVPHSSLSSHPSTVLPLLLIVLPPPHRLPLSLSPSSLSPLPRCVAPHRRCFAVLFRPSGRVQASVRGKRRCIAKTNHDRCRSSCFVTHPWGSPTSPVPVKRG